MDANDAIYPNRNQSCNCNSASGCAQWGLGTCPWHGNPPDPNDCDYYADID